MNENKMTTEELAKELEMLINKKAAILTRREDSYEEKYEYLECMLLDMVQAAKELKEDMDKNELKVSAIEAEGYLRFALSVECLLD